MLTYGIEKLEDIGIAYMASPTHTSDKLQPLEVMRFETYMYCPKKLKNQRVRKNETLVDDENKMDGLYIWECIEMAYTLAVTKRNVQ